MQARAGVLLCVLVALVEIVGCGGKSNSSNNSSGGGGGSNQPPTANAGGPYTATVNTSVSFSSTGSSDPQGQALTYAWNFGDSTTGSGASPSHTYTAIGIYTVSLTVTDTSGLTGTSTAKATVGMADVAMTGTVYSGTQPVSSAHVYLMAANTTGYGGAGIAAASTNASISLLNSTLTGASDSVGAYVTTNSNGSFSVSGDYTCTSGQQLYLYATGASGASWMAAVGACPGTSGSAITAKVNEVSTVAAAYALAGFATDSTHVSSSNTALAQAGIAAAFANAADLETLSSGTALTTTAANWTVPQTEIDTLANVLASCSTGGASCSTLFADATADGTSTGTKPTETATAAINIAHHPGVNVSGLYALASGGAFTPALTSAPNDWTIAISLSGSNTPETIAMDGSGNIWVADYGANSVLKLSSKGAVTSTLTSSTISGLKQPIGIAIDKSGNAWVADYGGGNIVEVSNSGSPVSPAAGYTGGGLNQPGFLAIDASGNVWIVNYPASVVELSSTGTVLASGGYSLGTSTAVEQIAIDGAGNVWITTSVNVIELSNGGSVLSGTNGYTGGGLGFSTGIAADSGGNIWVANHAGTNLTKLSDSGSPLSGTNGYSGGGLNDPNTIAIDGAGNVWVANANSAGVSELSSTGTALSGTNGYGSLQFARDIAVDGSGDVWVTDGATGSGILTEFIGAGVPVIAPLVAALPSTASGNGSSNLGTRP